MSEFSMNKYDGWEFTTAERISFSKDITYSDKWISDKDLRRNAKLSHLVIDENKLLSTYLKLRKELSTRKLSINFRIG